MSSINEKLSRVRKPRVHIKYDVETENGTEQKELPFVVGVLADLSADNAAAKIPLADRQFTQIDRDNFNQVMHDYHPQLQFRVENTLNPETNSEIAVNLSFKHMDDFNPENIVKQIPSLNALLSIRHKLRELLTKTDCSFTLESLLEQALTDPQALAQLASELEG